MDRCYGALVATAKKILLFFLDFFVRLISTSCLKHLFSRSVVCCGGQSFEIHCVAIKITM